MATVKIVAVGDSNTQAGAYASGTNDEWPFLLRNALAAAYPSTTYTVTNRGVSGTTPYDWRPGGSYLPTAVNDHADIYVIMLGTNGPVLTNTGSYTDAALATYESEMRAITSALLGTAATNNADGKPRVVLISPIPAVDWATLDGPDPYGIKASMGASFWYFWRPTPSLTARRDIVSTIAQSIGAPYLNGYGTMTAAGFTPTRTTAHPDVYDGIHLDSSGHATLNSALLPVVSTLLGVDGSVYVAPSIATYADYSVLSLPVMPETPVYADYSVLALFANPDSPTYADYSVSALAVIPTSSAAAIASAIGTAIPPAGVTGAWNERVPAPSAAWSSVGADPTSWTTR